MNGKQARRCRAIANAEAVRSGLWKKGDDSVKGKWYRRLLARLFPSIRRKYSDWVGRWYKRTLKLWAHRVYASAHDPEYAAFLRSKKRVDKVLRKKRYHFEPAK
jgi:hypothetical protein